MSTEKKISGYLEEIISDPSIFVVDIKFSGNNPQKKVAIVLDGDDGVSIDKCAEISRKLGGILEEVDLIDSKYTLEVSSPGLDQPLKLNRQYKKNIGRNLKVSLINKEKISGKLLDVDERRIKILSEKVDKQKGKKQKITEEMEILFSDIEKTNILVSFK